VIDYGTDIMIATKDGLRIKEVTTSKAVQAPTMEDVPEGAKIVTEILKSPRTPRPKKDKQAMAPMHVSPRNTLRSNLSMEEKGKAIMIETDEEEEDL